MQLILNRAVAFVVADDAGAVTFGIYDAANLFYEFGEHGCNLQGVSVPWRPAQLPGVQVRVASRRRYLEASQEAVLDSAQLDTPGGSSLACRRVIAPCRRRTHELIARYLGHKNNGLA